MKDLEYYKDKELEGPDEVFNFFINNLQKSILTWDFFVDWDKIREKVADVEEELSLLNILIGKENTEDKFIELLEKYPRIKKALSLLIAVRSDKLREIYLVEKDDIGKDLDNWHMEMKREYFKVNKKLNDKDKEELADFYKNSGLKKVFENKDIKDIRDYYFGVEVGMDTNARKNRTGNAMENVVLEYIKNEFSNFIFQATDKKMEEEWGLNLGLDKVKSGKAFDFAIKNSDDELFIIEVNYYSGGGTKLKSTAREYKDYEEFINSKSANFIWVTDGLGWNKAKNDLKDTFINNNYVFNLKMVSENILEEVIK